MSWLRSRRFGAAALLAAGICLAPGTATAAEITCDDVRVPVRIGLTTQSMYGRLCVPHGATTLQVLVPGGTYNSVYWDIDYGTLSYRLAMIQSLRPRFGRIVLVGHSIGSATATTEAARYHDVDGVVITGLTHHVNLPGAVPVFTTLIPAAVRLRAHVVPNYGHSLNFSPDAPGYHQAVIEWTNGIG